VVRPASRSRERRSHQTDDPRAGDRQPVSHRFCGILPATESRWTSLIMDISDYE